MAKQEQRAGGYDWLETWRRMYDAERAQGEAATDPAFARHADHWAHRASRFAKAARRHPQPDAYMAWLAPRLRPTDTVLDIGAGTGRYLPYLARQVATVIAVEPSPAMRAELAATVATAGLENIQVVDTNWPLEAALTADVVISAHVVYGVREVGPFLLGMERAARRLSVLFLGMHHPSAVVAPVWERVHGQARLPLPAALEALAVCHQLGLPAQLELVAIPPALRYASAEEALEDLRDRLRLAPNPTRDAAIRAAIADLLAPAADGTLTPRHQQRHGGVVWWEPDAVRRDR